MVLLTQLAGPAATRPKVLIPEKVSDEGRILLEASLDVHVRQGLSPADLVACIADYEALIVRSETRVTAGLLAAGKKLKVVARAGVGVDNVDVEAATKHGIIVVNSPVGNINAAAEHTIACRSFTLWSLATHLTRQCSWPRPATLALLMQVSKPASGRGASWSVSRSRARPWPLSDWEKASRLISSLGPAP